METVTVLDKTFSKSISHEEIKESIAKLIFLGILNGVFLFAADLFRLIEFQTQITFLKVASYQGTTSSGKVKRLIGINENIENKTVVVLEDIIDSGITMDYILKQLRGYEPKEIKIATLLYKPAAFIKDFKIDYVAIEIPNEFIVGYGLDYDGFGRNLKDIYTLVK